MGPLSVAALVAVLFISLAVPCFSDYPVAIMCRPPCEKGGVICSWNDGGNGYNTTENCQRSCGAPIGNGTACNLSLHNKCWWGYTDYAGWACYSGPAPCKPDETVVGFLYKACSRSKRPKHVGGCDCRTCCSKTCTCTNMGQYSQCTCGRSYNASMPIADSDT